MFVPISTETGNSLKIHDVAYKVSRKPHVVTYTYTRYIYTTLSPACTVGVTRRQITSAGSHYIAGLRTESPYDCSPLMFFSCSCTWRAAWNKSLTTISPRSGDEEGSSCFGGYFWGRRAGAACAFRCSFSRGGSVLILCFGGETTQLVGYFV